MMEKGRKLLDDLLKDFYRFEIHCGGDCAACKFGVKPQNYFWFTCPVKVARDMLDMRFSEPEKFDDMIG